MQIVVLDGYTLNPGDLSWSALQELGNCSVFERSTPSQIGERSRNANILLSNKAVVDGELINQLTNLQYIGVLATGYNNIDVKAAAAKGIPVCNVPAYGTDSVAQMTFALILELTNRVGHHSRAVAEGAWNSCPDFCFTHYPLHELSRQTMGIVGLGRIGSAVARIAKAFGMRVIASINRPTNHPDSGIEIVPLETLLRESDVVSLHCPLTEASKHLINRERLALMKSTAMLINTSRGPLVDETALAEALRYGQLAGAALDVLQVEPPKIIPILANTPNCIVTPHIAWATFQARKRLLNVAVENVKAFLSGAPVNIVNRS